MVQVQKCILDFIADAISYPTNVCVASLRPFVRRSPNAQSNLYEGVILTNENLNISGKCFPAHESWFCEVRWSTDGNSLSLCVFKRAFDFALHDFVCSSLPRLFKYRNTSVKSSSATQSKAPPTPEQILAQKKASAETMLKISAPDAVQWKVWAQPGIVKPNCDKALIEPDITEFAQRLDVLLSPAYRPTKNDIMRVFGGTNFLAEAEGCINQARGHDCLFLCYTNKDGVRIEVKDGENVCLMLTPPSDGKPIAHTVGNGVETNALKRYIWTTAEAVLNFPQSDVGANKTNLQFYYDLGDARVGSFTMDFRYRHLDNVDSEKDGQLYLLLHDRFGCWSDGRRILFWIDKPQKRGPNGESQDGKKRRFQYRADVP